MEVVEFTPTDNGKVEISAKDLFQLSVDARAHVHRYVEILTSDEIGNMNDLDVLYQLKGWIEREGAYLKLIQDLKKIL